MKWPLLLLAVFIVQDWTMDYSYDCSAFGSRGNFQVYIYNADGSIDYDDGPIAKTDFSEKI